jgi:hypothetical protein
MSPADARERFNESRKNKAEAARTVSLSEGKLLPVSYRPFDRRLLFYHAKFVDEMAHRPLSVWGEANEALSTLTNGAGAGPAVWLHSIVPDYHGFRGNYGGSWFSLWDRRPGGHPCNLNPKLLK